MNILVINDTALATNAQFTTTTVEVKMDAKDKIAIEVFRKIGIIWCIVPPQKRSYGLRIYQTLIFVTNMLFSAFAIYSNTVFFLNMKQPISTLMDILTSLFAVFLGLSIQFLCLWYPKQWRDILKHLRIGSDKGIIISEGMFVYFEVAVVHLTFFLKLIFDIWAWSLFGNINLILNYIFRHINEYFSMLLIIFLIHINGTIRVKFFMMNETLKRSHCVKPHQTVYGRVVQLIEKFNNLFGYQILFLMGDTIVTVLECLENNLAFKDLTTNVDLKILFIGVFQVVIAIVSI